VKRIEVFIETRMGRKITAIDETSREMIRRAIEKGISEGKGMEQIADDIDRAVDLEPIVANRAMVIARTEVISASNFGSQLGARSTGLQLEKQWLATPDTRTRDSHADADGQTRKLDEEYIVGGEALMFPGDPQGSAENVINCRCTEVYAEVGFFDSE
jgi:uncharacterized protein with gpF-like domain